MDYTDFLASQKRDPRMVAHDDLLARSHRATADRLGRLLGLSEWDAYKNLVQQRIEQAETLLAQAQARLMDDPPARTDDRMHLTVVIYGIGRQLAAYRDVIEFPARIIETAPQEATSSPR